MSSYTEKTTKSIGIKDTALFRQKVYINGKWQDSISGKTTKITNPSTGEVLGTVPECGAVEAKIAIEAANDAWPAWRSKTAKERALILRCWFELMMENQEDLARLMTAEQGKPLSESRGEVAYAASFIEWFAEEGKRIYGDTIPTHGMDKRVLVLKQPIGVTVAITPWNFPAAMITRKAAPALAAGCPMVIKPAPDTPFSAFALCELAERAGVPAGILSTLTGDAASIGGEFTGNPIVRKLSFTGSTGVGKLLMKQCSGTVKKMALELGGNAPFIVFDDADLEAAIPGAMASKFRNAGQTCVCANRILVQSKVYEKFTEMLANAAKNLKVADGFEDGTDQGPLINEAAVIKIESHIKDAVSKGGKLLAGGRRHELGGTFFEPTVISDVTTDMLVAKEETFGPMAPVFKFETEEEAISMANDTEFGLAAYFYSRDIGRIWRVSEGLEYGIVGVNEGIISTEMAPFGGVKESGTGREGSKYGIEDYLELKYLCIGGVNK